MENNESKEKIVYVVTHAEDNPEKAIIPFVLANGAMAMDVEVSIILQSNGVLLAKKGYAEKINHTYFDPLKKLMDQYIQSGGKIYLCAPCVKARNMENDIIEGAVIIGAAKVVQEALSAKVVFTY
ncbi:MAG: DsrE family protein [Elusimicrobiota bacterium]